MRGRAEEPGFAFYRADQRKQTATPGRVRPARIEVCRQPAGAFDGGDFHGRKVGLSNLGLKFFGAMEESCREIFRLACRIAVLPIAQIATDDRCKRWIDEEAFDQPG